MWSTLGHWSATGTFVCVTLIKKWAPLTFMSLFCLYCNTYFEIYFLMTKLLQKNSFWTSCFTTWMPPNIIFLLLQGQVLKIAQHWLSCIPAVKSHHKPTWKHLLTLRSSCFYNTSNISKHLLYIVCDNVCFMSNFTWLYIQHKLNQKYF